MIGRNTRTCVGAVISIQILMGSGPSVGRRPAGYSPPARAEPGWDDCPCSEQAGLWIRSRWRLGRRLRRLVLQVATRRGLFTAREPPDPSLLVLRHVRAAPVQLLVARDQVRTVRL